MINNVDNGKQLLGAPVFLDLSENALRTRLNLLITSGIILFISLANISINSESTLLGLKFNNLTDHSIKLVLLITNVYLLIHFVWYAMDGFLEWRLRLTGMRDLYRGGFTNEETDHPSNIRQSTLYNWWKEQVAQSNNSVQHLELVDELVSKWQVHLKHLEETEVLVPDWSDLQPAVKELKVANSNLLGYLKRMQDISQSKRIEISLERFDGWFKFFINSQNIRFLIIDLGLPIVLGIVAIVLLAWDIFFILDLNEFLIKYKLTIV